MTGPLTHVLAASQFDPDRDRIVLDLPAGQTLAEILDVTVPGLSEEERGRCRIALVTERGSEVVAEAYWHRVRPQPGVRVVIRFVPGGNNLRSVLTIVVAIAAVAAGQYYALALGFQAGTTGFALASAGISLGVTVVGQLLINALIPPVVPTTPESRQAENRYSISSIRNRADPNGAVPVILGQIRFAPPFAALSYSEIVGDWQYLRSAFNLGEGQLSLSDLRIGETSLSEFSDVDLETRDGLDTDLPVSLYPRQVAEERVSIELVRPLARNDLGEVIAEDPSVATPVVRTTGADADGASVLLAFPSGLVRFDGDGVAQTEEVSILVEHRLAEAGSWTEVETLTIRAAKLESFYRQHSWTFPSRGRWQVRLTMLTDENTDSNRQRRCSWAALQTLRPEYPLNYGRPLSLIATRIRATHQLSGALDNLTALAGRICLDYDHGTGTWVERVTSNPAALFRFVLQTEGNPKAVSDAGLDMDQIEDWHDFCRLNDLKYDRALIEVSTTLRDVLIEIAAAGRATPRHDGVKWGVTIDRAHELVVDHVSPRNSWDFKCQRAYFEPPHAFRVRFLDATNDFKEAERVVRWPDYEGEITLTEALELPGKTDPAEIWIEARRRMYEAIHRPDTYQVTQAGPVRVATRGDKVVLSHDVLDKVQRAARVKSVMGSLIELDELITMEAGEAYGIRFRVFAETTEGEDPDTIGASVVRTVATIEGEARLLTLTGSGDMPMAGDLILFGKAASESLEAIVTRVEATEDGHSILHLVDEAPIIDELLAADTVPAWSGRVGEEIDENLLQPSAPRFVSIRSGVSGTGTEDLVDYLIEPGSGAIGAASFDVDHRLTGAPSWTQTSIPAANGGSSIEGYVRDDIIEMRARAVSATGIEGPWGATVSLTVGAGDADIPAALDEDAIGITALLGGALIQVAIGADAATAALQVYINQTGTLDRETDAAGAAVPVMPQQSYSVALGDTTRQELTVGGNMGDAGDWDLDAGWAISGGIATHTPGTGDTIGQPLSASAGKFYRIAFTVSGRTAGSVTPRLTGGSDRPGVAVSADGDHADKIQAVTGNDTFEFLASSDFDGSIDDVSVYLETGACLDQGTHFIWIEPQNLDGVPGPASGSYSVTI
ncbi:TipJ family phage tail tip protein [Chachezhania antarctica]|uniref:TipJ family phage tail tip protein n=1 Tax=Chachezhania antarctica TaxID=2340860 RepID=UPI000EAE5842|nr:phage tail protein [Chachezhania antarctica]